MKIHALLRTQEYRGDHSADVAIALDVGPETTLEELSRHLTSRKPESSPNLTDWIEVRLSIGGPPEE